MAELRAFGYIRVSKEREDMHSPEIQRSEISRYCEQKGYRLLKWFEDLDISGRINGDGRPALKAMLERAVDGEADVIVCYRIDRLSREPAHHYAVLGLLKDAGVRVDSVHQPHEDSPEGEFLWGLNAILAQYESLKLGKRLRDMHRQLARSGRWHGGVLPYGWRRVKDERGVRLELEPETAAVRRRIHELYQGGWSCVRIARDLNERGVRTMKGTTWSDGLVYQMLLSPYQTGKRLVDGELVGGGNIEPLLEEETYRRTLELLRARHKRRGRTPSQPLSSRLLRCASCGGAMVIEYWKSSGEPVPRYRCQGRRQGTCERGVMIKQAVLLPYVEEKLLERIQRMTRRAPKPKQATAPTLVLVPAAEELEKARESLARLHAMYAEGDLAENEYQRARRLQRQKVEKLEARLKKATEKVEDTARSELLAVYWEDLARLTLEAFRSLSVQAQRDIYDLVVKRISVSPAPVAGWKRRKGREFPVSERVRIEWR